MLFKIKNLVFSYSTPVIIPTLMYWRVQYANVGKLDFCALVFAMLIYLSVNVQKPILNISFYNIYIIDCISTNLITLNLK